MRAVAVCSDPVSSRYLQKNSTPLPDLRPRLPIPAPAMHLLHYLAIVSYVLEGLLRRDGQHGGRARLAA